MSGGEHRMSFSDTTEMSEVGETCGRNKQYDVVRIA